MLLHAKHMLEEYHTLKAAADKEHSELEEKRELLAQAEERVDAKQASLDSDTRKFELEQDMFDAQVKKETAERAAPITMTITTKYVAVCCSFR